MGFDCRRTGDTQRLALPLAGHLPWNGRRWEGGVWALGQHMSVCGLALSSCPWRANCRGTGELEGVWRYGSTCQSGWLM